MFFRLVLQLQIEDSGESRGASQAAEIRDAEGDGGFNPRARPTESTLALAAEGRFPPVSPEIPSFSAAASALGKTENFGGLQARTTVAF